MTGNVIAMNRGDSYNIEVVVQLEGEKYVLKDEDTLYFGVMDPHVPFEDALIRKRYTVDDLTKEGTVVVNILPEDTIDLIPGKYYYMIKLKLDHYDRTTREDITGVKTIVDKTKFVIWD